MNVSEPAWLDQWAALQLAGVEDDVVSTYLDADVVLTHPVPGVYACWAVDFRREKWRKTMPPPTYSCITRDRTMEQAVWFLTVPVRPEHRGYDHAVNLWKMVSAALTHELAGVEVTEIVDPFLHHELMTWTGRTYMMREIRTQLTKAGLFTNHLHPDFLTGGTARTPAQTEARRLNIVKAREQAQLNKAARALADAHRVMTLVDAGSTHEQIAEARGIKVASVATTVARARARIAQEREKSAPAIEPAAPPADMASMSIEPSAPAADIARHIGRTADMSIEEMLAGL